MKKKKLLAELQSMNAQNQYLLTLMMQMERGENSRISNSADGIEMPNKWENDSSQYFDTLEECGRKQRSEQEQLNWLIDNYKNQMKKLKHSNCRKQRKVEKCWKQKYSNLLNSCDLLQEEIQKEKRKRKKAEQDIYMIKCVIAYALYKEGVTSIPDMSLKAMIKSCKADHRQLGNMTNPPIYLENHGGKNI